MRKRDATIAADLVSRIVEYSDAPDIVRQPRVIDVGSATPDNPPQAVQQKFVGASYRDAYQEAARFVTQAERWAQQHSPALHDSSAVLDFGIGWGRISRMLLTRVPPTRLFGLDVDAEMIALVQATLPGINALTVDPMPPSALRTALVEHAFAFSVFSHLAEAAHRAWAEELARVVIPGGLVFVTVLDGAFLTQVRQCQELVAQGGDDPFASSLAQLLPDLASAQAAYQRSEFIYAAPAVEDGPRTVDFYGWAIAPRAWMQSVWGAAGFEIIEWVDSHVLFPQAMVCLRRDPQRDTVRRRLFGR